jgi:hypothetical protein
MVAPDEGTAETFAKFGQDFVAHDFLPKRAVKRRRLK